ncbi:MAG: phosphate acyltransferase, partial [Pseudomonadota bacterium]
MVSAALAQSIALDAMGGDQAPDIVIAGAALALEQEPSLHFTLFGDEAQIRTCLAGYRDLTKIVEIRHTPDRIASDDKPSMALRHGRNSSMRLAIDAVRKGEASAVVSAGNTGALMAIAKFVLKTLPGIDRPAIAAVVPTGVRQVLLLDLGANIECSPEHLFQFAVMGEVFSRAVLGVPEPKVALLNVGTEDVKGDDVVRAAASLIRGTNLPIDFVGFVEGDGILG